MHRKILLLIVFLLVLTGCKKNTELVEPYKMSNQIIETMNGKTEQGIYGINSSKKKLIIYRGVEKGIHTLSYSIKNKVLTIIFETEELNQPQDYVYKINSNSLFDTIQISIDGKDETFNTIFVQ